MSQSLPALPARAVERTIRLSYAQATLGAIYAASTGGMFLIGYALKLGADNLQVGLLSTLPMVCGLAQLLSSGAIERGLSRRKLTIFAALASVLGWGAVILIPYALRDSGRDLQIASLIAVVTMVTLLAWGASNARSAWLADLIPEQRRGMFFGKTTMYAGIIGTSFALAEGIFLDQIEHAGLGAFSMLFAFGMVFGLVNVYLFVPQPEIPHQKSPDNFSRLARDSFRNPGLLTMMAWGVLWQMQTIAGPFYITYMLRDLDMPFFQVGLINSVVSLVMLLSSPFWGRMVDRYGCRPVLITCTWLMAPLPLCWIWVDSAAMALKVVIPVNILAGIAAGGVTVAANTLLYKITPALGRSVQFAVYTVLVLLLAAPLPALGGKLPAWLAAIGINMDLRCTFYCASAFLFASAIAARKLHEPGAHPTALLMRNLPWHIRVHLLRQPA